MPRYFPDLEGFLAAARFLVAQTIPAFPGGTLIIAANHGAAAQLNITDGWLRAASDVVIGGNDAASGTLNLSGGELYALQLKKGSASEFNFTGGTLQTESIDFNLEINGGTLAVGANDTRINGFADQLRHARY